MSARVKELTGKKLQMLTVSTFHAFGVRILREDIERLGWRENFSIYDDVDRNQLIKDTGRELGFTADALDVVWAEQLVSQDNGVTYSAPGFQVFEDQISTACGSATSAVGPFYCPSDHTVYLDLDFFRQMEDDYGAVDAPLAQEYVVAHEWGHHIQNLLGTFSAHDSQEQGPQGAGVRMELQADCYAGIWMHWASATVDPDSGQAFLRTPTTEEITTALTTAQAIGDDRLQQKYQGTTNPESWTHGSAAQRQRWLTTGLESGSLNRCDTFSAKTV